MVRLFECRLNFENPIASKRLLEIRHFFGEDMESELLEFNRFDSRETKFHYPKVQFKILDTTAYLIALDDAAEFMQKAEADDQIRIQPPENLRVLHHGFETRIESIGITESPCDYKFVTPWLALNDRNFGNYTKTRSKQNRNDELNRILVGNCFSLINGLAIPLDGRIDIKCGRLTSVKASINGRGQIGFLGTFTANLQLPSLIGLGKSVSRGFGTVTAIR